MTGHDDLQAGIAKQQFDFRHFQEELSGVAGGRLLRFLTPEMYELMRADLRAEKREDFYSKLLLRLLTNERYRQTYERVWNTLENYERQAEQALERIRQRMQELDAELADLRGRAARLPEGTQVYRDQSGVVRTEDGALVEGPELQAVIWPENAPAYEEIAASRRERAALASDETAVEAYQVNVLGAARDQLSNDKAPLSQPELEAAERRIKDSVPQLTSSVSFETELSAPTAKTAAVQVPKL